LGDKRPLKKKGLNGGDCYQTTKRKTAAAQKNSEKKRVKTSEMVIIGKREEHDSTNGKKEGEERFVPSRKPSKGGAKRARKEVGGGVGVQTRPKLALGKNTLQLKKKVALRFHRKPAVLLGEWTRGTIRLSHLKILKNIQGNGGKGGNDRAKVRKKTVPKGTPTEPIPSRRTDQSEPRGEMLPIM